MGNIPEYGPRPFHFSFNTRDFSHYSEQELTKSLYSICCDLRTYLEGLSLPLQTEEKTTLAGGIKNLENAFSCLPPTKQIDLQSDFKTTLCLIRGLNKYSEYSHTGDILPLACKHISLFISNL